MKSINDKKLNSIEDPTLLIKKTPEEKKEAAYQKCKGKIDKNKIGQCVKLCYLTLCAGIEGVPIVKLATYKENDEDKTAIQSVIDRIKKYKKSLDNGSNLPNPVSKRLNFKRKSKRNSKKVSAKRSKKTSKRQSMKLSQNRSKKRSKRVSQKRSKKRSKRVSQKRSKNRSKRVSAKRSK